MTVASEITRIEGNISAAYLAADAKGATMPATENSDNLATCIASIPSGGGGSGKYQLLERVTDDSNNEIGTVSGFFTDENDVEYAVVCLDAQYRLASGAYCSNASQAVTDLPNFSDQTIYTSTQTSTFNTQKILDFCAANGYTSASSSHCRSKSFVVDGVTYYGQLPNILELIDIFRQRININTKDTSSSTHSSLIIPTSTSSWSSNQCSAYAGWNITNYGNVYYTNKTNAGLTIPVLEIPNA